MAFGKKTGGRQLGTRNKKTAERIEAVAANGETPLDYMLRVLRDPATDERRRDEMAKAAAPYLHPRLAHVDQTIKRVNADSISDSELAAIIKDSRRDIAEAPADKGKPH